MLISHISWARLIPNGLSNEAESAQAEDRLPRSHSRRQFHRGNHGRRQYRSPGRRTRPVVTLTETVVTLPLPITEIIPRPRTTKTRDTSTTTSTSTTPTTTFNLPPPAVILPPRTTLTSISTTSSSSSTTPTLLPSTASPTAALPSPQSSLKLGSVVGGVIGTLLGLAAIVFAVTFFKRWKNNREFDADAFKRQSTMLVEDRGSSLSYAGLRGYSSNRPSVTEHTLSHNHQQPHGQGPSSPQFNSTQYVRQDPLYNQGSELYSNTLAASIDKILPPAPAVLNPSASATQTGSLHSAPNHDSQYISDNRQPTSGGAQLARSASLDPFNPAHQIDLTRSSITPYQAIQYAEISRRLRDSKGLPSRPTSRVLPPRPVSDAQDDVTPDINDFPAVPDTHDRDFELYTSQPRTLKPATPLRVPLNLVPDSPFADPVLQRQPSASAEELRSEDSLQEQFLAFPTVPTYAGTPPASTPPLLPDIQLQEAENRDSIRGYYDEFPVSALTNSFLIPSPMSGQAFQPLQPPAPALAPGPIKPSPLRLATVADIAALPTPENTPSPPLSSKWKGKQRETTYSVYSDAYTAI